MNVFGDALPGSEYTYIFGQHPAACMKKHHIRPAIQTFLWSAYDRLCIWKIWLLLSSPGQIRKQRAATRGNNAYDLPHHLR